ncbi:ABC transporter permease [Albibacillus kandeliae]|uniref:ABC transporter permease n=1 Tax=Albibacillus kandeliae TaxID=2174228 RepID=UPI000D6962BA|nr:ABC transporter permease [Albibacillus kandeliae]
MAALPPPLSPSPPPALPPANAGRRRFATLRTVLALMLREMSTRYGNTPGGYVWAILEPLGAILVLSVGFSLVLRSPSLGTSFLLFYATGYLPFSLFNSISNTTARALNFSRALLRYPAVTWLDAVLARFLLNTLTSVVIATLLCGSILILEDAHAALDAPPVIEGFVLTMLLGLGVGTVNCALIGLLPVWEVAWSIITRPLFLASGVLYIYEDLPQMARDILWYNPLIHVIGLIRTGFYPTYAAAYVNTLYVLGLSLALLAMGLILLGRYHRDILNS